MWDKIISCHKKLSFMKKKLQIFNQHLKKYLL